MFTSFEMNFFFLSFFFFFFFLLLPFFAKLKYMNIIISDSFFFNVSLLKNLFLGVLFLNLVSLIPYIFSFTSTPSVFLWGGIFFFSIFIPLFLFNFKNNLAHFLPQSSPFVLSFFMVVIEMVSMLARPLALSIRLMANITAGHLLIHLFSHGLESGAWYLFFFFILLLFLETAVAFIQAYVFTMLLTLYTEEMSSTFTL